MLGCLGLSRTVPLFALGVSTLIVVLSCSSKDKSCDAGDLRCRCYPNQTCNEELVCLSNVCVEPDAGGEGGTGTGTGGRGAASGGRADEEGGSTGEGAGGSSRGGAAGTTGGETSSEGGGSSEGGTPNGDAGAGGTTSTGGTAGGTSGGKTTSGGTSMGGATTGGQVGVAGNGEGATSGVPDGSLLINGDFSDADAHWKFTESDLTPSILNNANGRYCIKANGSVTNFNLGFPLSSSEAFTVEPGVSYTVSYRAAAIVQLYVLSKVGLAITPYTSLNQKSNSVGSTWSQVTYSFVPASGSSAAGFVLSGTLYGGNEICFDDVSLVRD